MLNIVRNLMICSIMDVEQGAREFYACLKNIHEY